MTPLQGEPFPFSHRTSLGMFEQAFRNIDDALRKEAGCTTELDYTEQTSWLLFLKYLDGLEQDRAARVLGVDGRMVRMQSGVTCAESNGLADRVQFVQKDVRELSRSTYGEFDV